MTPRSIALICLAVVSPLLAEEDTVDEPSTSSKVVSLMLETVSLPLADAAALIRRNSGDPELYKTCIDRIGDGRAVQESLTVLRCKDGGEVSNDSVLETIYPTEVEPPELPNSVSLAQPAKDGGSPIPDDYFDAWATPATPTSFETRNLGLEIEAAASIDAEGGLISLKVVPAWVRLVGHSSHGQGLSNTRMPEFELQRFATAVTLRRGEPFLLGSFNRTPESVVAPDEAGRVWFAFVTARVVGP